MARVDDVSDVESVSTNAKPKTKRKPSDKDRESTTPENGNESEGQADNDEEDDEEEYEIEAILDSKKGIFPEGRTGYLVSWKGYGEEHNGWVDEKDAGNATALIEEYWRNQKKKKAGRKSLDPKPKSPAKGGRKSMTKEGSSEVGSASTAQKKRGRKPKTTKEDSDVEMEDEDEDKGVPAKKKPRKSNGNARTTSPQYYGEPIGDDVAYGDMKKWLTTKSWEHIVSFVDTVERTDGGGLDVYFTLTDGTRAKEDSAICAERFPQKMIQFYQSNLRWKEAYGPDEAVSQV